MTRKTLIAGNWKMYKTIKETTDFIEELVPIAKSATCELRIAPSFTALSAAVNASKGTNILIGGQNMSDAEEGAFTGEISAKMLRDVGARFVILGHSERRSLFGETDEIVHKKLIRAVLEKLPAILCIGETEEEREGRSEVLKRQLDVALKGFSSEEIASLVVAYEPVWAIGTGFSATPEMAEDAHAVIRAHMKGKYGEEFADKLLILYGGSVKPSNIDSLLNQPDIDGALIGGASLDIQAFGQMVTR